MVFYGPPFDGCKPIMSVALRAAACLRPDRSRGEIATPLSADQPGEYLNARLAWTAWWQTSGLPPSKYGDVAGHSCGWCGVAEAKVRMWECGSARKFSRHAPRLLWQHSGKRRRVVRGPIVFHPALTTQRLGSRNQLETPNPHAAENSERNALAGSNGTRHLPIPPNVATNVQFPSRGTTWNQS